MKNLNAKPSLLMSHSSRVHSKPIYRVLLVEDNEANRLVAKTILKRDGHIVTAVESGKDAINACLVQSFDIIFLDILMPTMNGPMTLKKIRQINQKHSTTPVFALTAHCAPADQNTYLMAGFNGVIPKPLRRHQLENILKKHDRGVVPMVTAASTQMGAPKILLDMTIIDQLNETGDRQTLVNIQRNLWADISSNLEILKQIKDETLKGNPEALTKFRKTIHSIKGLAMNFGLARANYHAARLQNAPIGDIPLLLKEMCVALADSYAPLKNALNS